MRTLLIFITLNVTTMIVQAQTPTRYLDAYSVYITKDLARSKAFYVQWLDFEIAFESTWFIYMQSKGDHKVSFALIDEKHPSTPPAYGAFNGRGSFLTLQVEDAEAVYN